MMSRILLIEPDAILANSYSEVLRSDGHDIDSVKSAQGGIHAADETTPDCVIIELQLVGHSGIEFLYEFRSYEDWRDVPVIIQTQVPPSEFTASWRLLREELGVSAYIYKSQSSHKDLISAVNSALPIKS